MTSSSSNPIQTSGSKTPLFWVRRTCPVRYLDHDQPIYTLTRKIQDEHIPFYSTIEEIASFCIQEIYSIKPEGPYILGGYCFWGVVALEMASQLKKQGHEVSYLFLVETVDRCFLKSTAHYTCPKENDSLKSKVNRHTMKLAQMNNPEKFSYVIQKLHYFLQLNNISLFRKFKKRVKIAICRTFLFFRRPTPQSLVKFYTNTIHAKKLLDIYTTQFYNGKIILFNTDKNHPGKQPDWNYLADEVKLHVISGAEHMGHLGILKKPFVEVWAKLLNMYLNKAQAENLDIV